MPRRVAGVEEVAEAVARMAAAGRGAPGGRAARAEADGRALLVAISGIDASGKGVIAARLAAALERAGFRVALIALDPWHHPARVRFAERDPGGHFFKNAFRFDELFERVIEPLRRDRAIDLETTLLDLGYGRVLPAPVPFRER